MKRIAVLLLSCILVTVLSQPVIADGGFSIGTEEMVPIEPEPVYKKIDLGGRTVFVDSEGYIANEITFYSDVLIDVELYSGLNEPKQLFGVPVLAVYQLFLDEWLPGIHENLGNIYPYLVFIPDNDNMAESIEMFNNNEHISAASQNQVFEMESYIVDDTVTPPENSLNNNELSPYDEYTAMTNHYDLMGVAQAWDYGFVGSDDITVVVIDRGAYPNHPDFDNNMNFTLAHSVADPTNPNDVTPIDPESPDHGQAVAGIIGGDLGDGGINGICQNVNMVPILYVPGVAALNAALEYAGSIGADVINLSFSVNEYQDYEEFFAATSAAFVVSAGNKGLDIVNANGYYGHINNISNWFVVGSSTIEDEKCDFSNYSSEYVDIFAPSQYMYVAEFEGENKRASGTSLAAPMFSAAIALLLSHAPHLTPVEAANWLLDHVDVVDGFEDYCVTGGRLAIDKAILALYEDNNRGAYSKGDVNGDSTIDMFDYYAARSAYYDNVTLTAQEFAAADINEDETLDVFDFLAIQNFLNRTAYFSP